MVHQGEFKRIKRLIIALGLSGVLNIFLITVVLYSTVKEQPPIPYFELKPVADPNPIIEIADRNNIQAIKLLRQRSSSDLHALLSSEKMAENGYYEKDLALSSLVAFHHFDIHRALGTPAHALQQRQIAYGKHKNGNLAEITVFPELTPLQWKMILDYVQREKWTQSPHGLFLLMKLRKKDIEPSLADAFAMTMEFKAAEMLFLRSKYQLDRSELLQLLIEGDWEHLAKFYGQQRASQDLSDTRRQQFLMEYIESGSKTAAFLLLKTDYVFAIRKLDDGSVMKLLNLLDAKSPDSEKFVTALLNSPRGDGVWKMAATRLYEYTGSERKSLANTNTDIQLASKTPKQVIKGIEKPQVIPEAAKTTSIALSKNDPKSKPTTIPGKDKLYIVQDGDSLWKISRRFNIDIERIKKHNRLDTSILKTGMALRIPES